MKRSRTSMPAALRADVGQDPEYSRCALQGLLLSLVGPCDGRVTREHAVYYAGKKVQLKWAIPPICAKHHGVDSYQDGGTAAKEIREWVALNRATDEELFSKSKVVNQARRRDYLNGKYGVYVAPPIPSFVSVDFTIVPKKPKPAPKKLTPEELFEREVRAYARDTGTPIEESRAFLKELV